MTIIRNPETSAALLILYHCADLTTDTARETVLRAIAHLTGHPFAHILRTWQMTR